MCLFQNSAVDLSCTVCFSTLAPLLSVAFHVLVQKDTGCTRQHCRCGTLSVNTLDPPLNPIWSFAEHQVERVLATGLALAWFWGHIWNVVDLAFPVKVLL